MDKKLKEIISRVEQQAMVNWAFDYEIGIKVSTEDIQWLIKQAEKMSRVEKTLDSSNGIQKIIDIVNE